MTAGGAEKIERGAGGKKYTAETAGDAETPQKKRRPLPRRSKA